MLTSAPVDEAASDRPRSLPQPVATADRIFRSITSVAAASALLIVGATAFFLVWDSREAFEATGIVGFFTSSSWNASTGSFGVFGLLLGTIAVAVIALVIAVPLAVGLALFVNEYAPGRIRRYLVGTVDLLAALPSLVYGMWGLFSLMGPLVGVARWLGHHLNAIPFLRITEDSVLSRSAFCGGVVVAIMVTPVITSVTRDVMAQCPRELCEGALGLGAGRWAMIKAVLLPFSRSGIIGAVLLGFGRALGETIAVAIIVAPVITFNAKVLTEGEGTIGQLIATRFGEAGSLEVSALVAAGLALFLLTLVVNLLARSIVRKQVAA